jgi:diguanylate cyclase (GGDEF)-like protein
VEAQETEREITLMDPAAVFIKFLTGSSKPLLLLACLCLVAGIGFIDYLAKDFSLLILDLAPIFLAAWFIGPWAGILIALASASSWLITDMMETPLHSHQLVHYWNAVAQFAFFAAMACFLAALRNSLLRERELARRDPLTGAFNGRAFIELAWHEINMARRYKRPMTFAYMDIDNFKDVNDRFGHATGDELLRVVTKTLRGNLRSVDAVSRLGGDEFAILLPETSHDGASATISRLRNLLADMMRDNGWPTTFSIGVASYTTPPEDVDRMIKKSDALMYEAKSAGKNTVKYEVI